MFAVKSISWRLFHERIVTRHEPRHPLHGSGTQPADAEKRVDMVVQDFFGDRLFLIEAETPMVLEVLREFMDEVPIRSIDLSSNSSPGAKILNKARGLFLSRC